VARIVDEPDSAYSSIDEFIRVAVENQLALEDATDQLLDSRTPLATTPAAPTRDNEPLSLPVVSRKAHRGSGAEVSEARASVSDIDLLLRPGVDDLPRAEPMAKPERPLSAFTNRLTPLLAGPRVLANLTAKNGQPSVDLYSDSTAKAARAFGLRLRSEDEAAGRRSRHRRSTAWPIGDDESKSLIRFRNCFMFSGEQKGGISGPLVDLGLVAVVDGNVIATDVGARFASLTVPAIDEPGGVDLLIDDHRAILADALAELPGERVEIEKFLVAVNRSSGAQDAVDKQLASEHEDWSEAQVVSHRAAMVGRLRDLQVIDIDALPNGKARLFPARFFDKFTAAFGRQEGNK